MNERNNKIVIGLVFGFDFLLVLMGLFCMFNPDIHSMDGVNGFIENFSEIIIFVRIVIFFGVMIGFTFALGILYKFLVGSRLLISMYHACLVNFCITILIILGFWINKPFFGLIMVFLTVFILYYGYFNTKIETIKAKGLNKK